MLATIILIVMMAIAFSAGSAGATNWTVSKEWGGADHSKIQDAIDASDPGDNILIHNGTYTEHVRVNVSVNLIGNGTDATNVSGGYSMGDTIRVTVDHVNITGLNVTASGTDTWDAGLDIQLADDVNVWDCRFYDNAWAVFLYMSDQVNITDCLFTNNSEGMHLYTASNATIRNCTIVGSEYEGVDVYSDTRDCLFVDNNITLNNRQRHYLSVGFRIDSSNNITLRNNLISKTPRYCLRVTESRDCTFQGNDIMYGRGPNDNNAAFELKNSNNNTLIGNNVSHGGKMGLRLERCDNETVVGNYMTETSYLPFYILDSHAVNASDNWASDNNRGALGFSNVSDLVVTGNTAVRNNGPGIYLSLADEAIVSGNDCHNNRGSGIYFWRMGVSAITGNNVSFNNKYVLQQETNSGITLRNSTWNNISHNYVNNNPKQGVLLFEHSENNTLFGNDIVFNCGGDAGVYVNNCPNTTMMANNVSNSTGDGVQLYSSEYSTVTGNTINGNNMNGTQTGGLIVMDSDHSFIAGNEISWNTGRGLYLSDSTGINATGNEARNNTEAGIYFYFSHNLTVHDCNATGNGFEGIHIVNCVSITVIENDVILNNQDDAHPYNHAGLYLSESSYSNITGNYIRGNPWYGARLYQADHNTFYMNQIIFNCGGQSGIYIYDSNHVGIWYNNVSNSTGSGLELSQSDHLRIFKNTINGNNKGGDGAGGIYMSSCDQANIWYNEVSRNYQSGVLISTCYNPSLWYNEIHDNTWWGVRAYGSASTWVRYTNITGNGYSGIYLLMCDDFNVGNNDVLNNNIGSLPEDNAGIFVRSCSEGYVWTNDVLGNTEYGIVFSEVDNASISSNHIRYTNDTGAGMALSHCDNLTVIWNYVSYNRYFGIDSDYCKYSVFHNNTIRYNGRPGWWYAGFSGSFCNNDTWVDNYVQNNNGNGISYSPGDHIRIENNSVKGNTHGGIVIGDGSEWYIANNTIAGNRWGVFFVGNANWSTINYNEIFYNDEYGVRILSGNNNYIHHNNFYDNGNGTSQGYDNGTNNHWDDCSEGNYWDDWGGSGNYSIDGDADAYDEYPLGNATENNAPEKVPEFAMIIAVSTVFIAAVAIRRRRR